MSRLNAARVVLKDLGVHRSTANEIRAYLLDISTNFERAMNDALQKRYGLSMFKKCPELRLPTLLISRQDKFANDMALYGKEYRFLARDDNENSSGIGEEDEDSNSDDNENAVHDEESGHDVVEIPNPGKSSAKKVSARQMRSTASQFAPSKERSASVVKHPYPVRHEPRFPQLVECTIDNSEGVARKSKTGIMAWITDEHENSRGFELGGIDPSLLTTVFGVQAQRWDLLSLGYVSDVIEIVHSFLLTLLEVVVHDDHVRAGLVSRLQEGLQIRYRRAFDHAKFLLDVEKQSVPTTANHYFNDNLEKARQTRIQNEAKKRSFLTEADGKIKGKRAIYLENLGHTDNMSNKQHVVRDFHDVLKAYYKVALKRFIDNMSHQAALYHLVAGPESPLKLFSAAYVGALTDLELLEIAGEDSYVQEKREILAKEIATLEEGKRNI